MNNEYMKVSTNDHSSHLRCKKSVSKADIYVRVHIVWKNKFQSMGIYCGSTTIVLNESSNVERLGHRCWLNFFVTTNRMNDSFRGIIWVWFLLLLFSRAYMVQVFTFECVHGLFFSFLFFSMNVIFPPVYCMEQRGHSFILYAITRRGGVQTQ